MQRKYEVIRLIKQNAGCHIVMDYVEGEILAFYLKNHPETEKEQIFLWLRQIVKQLDSIRCVKGINRYGYVTPYCMVVKKDKSIAFLDLKAESNASILENVGKYQIQKLFFPLSAQMEETDYDCYSLGKTIQFIFAHTELKPSLTKREGYKFQKIISKCLKEHSKKSYQNISDILKEFPKRKEKNQWFLRIVLSFMAVIGVGLIAIVTRVTETQNQTVTQEFSLNAETFFDLGLTYFAEREDYQMSRLFFEKSKSEIPLGEAYENLAEFMCGDGEKTGSETEEILEKIEEKIQGKWKTDDRYIRSLLRGYMRIDSQVSRKKIMELGEMLLQKNQWRKEECELRETLASIYTANEEYEKAIEEYEVLCEWNKSEALYKILIELYDRNNQEEKALGVCHTALAEYPKSNGISLHYIRILCRSMNIGKEELEQSIEERVHQFPELLEEPEFQKLQVEYGIRWEGEHIWVER